LNIFKDLNKIIVEIRIRLYFLCSAEQFYAAVVVFFFSFLEEKKQAAAANKLLVKLGT
jgi:hypothetical protein